MNADEPRPASRVAVTPLSQTLLARGQEHAAPRAGVAARRWAPVHWLFGLGVACLAVEAWTLTAWLADGPHGVTTHRDRGDASWWVARAWEGGLVVLALVMVAYLVRSYRRDGRLGFDHQFALAGLLTMWSDPIVNYYAPLFSYSTQWTNVNTWLGHVPFVINPDAGRLAWPYLSTGILYVFVVPAAAIVGCWVVRKLKDRQPGISNARCIAVLVVFAAALDLVYEGALYQANLWTWIGLPNQFLILGGAHKYPWIEYVTGIIWFVVYTLIRYHVDDKGRRLHERGLEAYSPRRRFAISQVALIALFHVGVVVATIPLWIVGFYSGPPLARLPGHAVNGLCDAPGISGTRYGPCPGTPGFRLPLRGGLPGENP